MSIRMIAEELYRTIREVAAIEKRIPNASGETREGLESALRKARARRDCMRNILEGHKG